MNTTDKNFVTGSDQGRTQESAPAINWQALQSLSKPIGTFGGTTNSVLRVRDGRAVPGDTGDQGGGQN